MTKNLVMQALFRGASAKRPARGLILHSDRGSQYCAHDYQKLLKQFGMTASMSRKGDCRDNAPMESFWGTLKNELVHHRRYRTRSAGNTGDHRAHRDLLQPAAKTGTPRLPVTRCFHAAIL